MNKFIIYIVKIICHMQHHAVSTLSYTLNNKLLKPGGLMNSDETDETTLIVKNYLFYQWRWSNKVYLKPKIGIL